MPHKEVGFIEASVAIMSPGEFSYVKPEVQEQLHAPLEATIIPLGNLSHIYAGVSNQNSPISVLPATATGHLWHSCYIGPDVDVQSIPVPMLAVTPSMSPENIRYTSSRVKMKMTQLLLRQQPLSCLIWNNQHLKHWMGGGYITRWTISAGCFELSGLSIQEGSKIQTLSPWGTCNLSSNVLDQEALCDPGSGCFRLVVLVLFPFLPVILSWWNIRAVLFLVYLLNLLSCIYKT